MERDKSCGSPSRLTLGLCDVVSIRDLMWLESPGELLTAEATRSSRIVMMGSLSGLLHDFAATRKREDVDLESAAGWRDL